MKEFEIDITEEQIITSEKIQELADLYIGNV